MAPNSQPANQNEPDLLGHEAGGTDELGPDVPGTDELGHEAGGTDILRPKP
jgi:hypothetical protein